MSEQRGVEDAKKNLRKVARARRAAAHDDCAAAAREALANASLQFLDVALGCISGFHPYQDEIDCLGLLERLAADGWLTCLPVVVGAGRALEFRAWAPGDALEPGAWNIPAPPASSAVVEPDVLLVPMLAFDERGYRLGYGGGFYDRSLEALRQRKRVVAIGVAFSAQQVDAVPHEAHDQPLDWVLTERGALHVASAGGRPGRSGTCV